MVTVNDSNKKLSDVLNVDFVSDNPIIAVTKQDIPAIKSEKNETLQGDFKTARGNIHNLIDTGMDALDGLLKVATAGDSPRAYEVLTNMIKTLSDMNKDLIDIHDKLSSAESSKTKISNTTNNSIYVGSTSDLQNLINRERSPNKALEDLEED